ncbi:streptomycin adenylyltransferase family protein [Clostridium argentinense CDC 2741]|uniref:Streptomycin adenylyltransferase family protein n=1 Tax=Clostridium argentinense CDC 2741 TaxID=1418104 RepID=A0A0C1R797_9CLOT|nr:streptomycin adenylyltransferase family protein [Clostridium argentinense CDC 2741]
MREYGDCCNEFWNVTPYVVKGLCREEILFAIDHLNQILRHELLRMISWNVGIETGFTLSVDKNYKFLDKYIPDDLWNRLLSTYCKALFICHELFRKVSKEVAEVLGFVYTEYDKDIIRYTKDLYNQYVSKIENGTKI